MIAQIVRKVLEVKERYGKKVMSVIAMCLVMFILMGSVFNVNAQDNQLPEIKVSPQDTWTTGGEMVDSANESEGPNAHRLVNNQVTGATLEFLMILDPSVLTTSDAISNNPDISPVAKQGLVGVTNSNVIALVDSQPRLDIPNHLAREWVPGYKDNTYSAYAADGFDYLVSIGIDTLWEQTRIIAYTLFVVIMIASGFMIMFRHKIGGQLVVSVYNTIPRVIVGLILVTFSFAIVGMLMNFGAVMVNVIKDLIGGNDFITINGPFDLLGSLLNPQLSQASTIGGWGAIIGVIAGAIALIAGTGGTVGVVAGIAGIAAIIPIIILAVVVIYASVQVFMTLIKAYLGIILDTILAPIYLALAVIPGMDSLQADWINRLLRNVLTFPLVFFFLNLSSFILNKGVDLTYPTGLMGGDISQLSTGNNNVLISWLFTGVLALYLFFVAAESPKFLDAFLPQAGGRNTQEVLGGVQATIKKIPLIGGFFG